MTFHAVAQLDQLSDDQGMRVQAGAEEIVLVRHAGEVHAFQANCPHAGAPLEEGAICEGYLICPWHKAAFALDSGLVCEPPALSDLARYRTKVEDGTVWVDDQQLVPAQPSSRDDARSFVVIGAGAAGAAAVSSLRARGFGGQLTWIDAERHPAYDRTSLSKFVLSGEMSPEEIPPLLEGNVQRNTKLRRVHGKVRSIEPANRRINLADGQTLTYDAALLATGGKPQRPDIPGAQLQGAFVLRSRDDAEQLLASAQPGQTAVLIGDSFIGLEAASALCKYGMRVHVAARHEVPLVKQVGERIGRALRSWHESNGVVFHTPREPVRLEGESEVQAVMLDNGERIETRLVLFGTGVKPATGLVRGLELADDQSIKVDAGMRAAEGLWAAGDMVTFPLAGRPVRIEHWRVAQQHARIAAANMLGEKLEYADVPFFWTYHHGRTYEVLGHASDWQRIEWVGAPESERFIALLCVDEQVQGVVACEHSRAMAALSQRMKRPLPVEEALALISA
ncbi:3-phenylpropionate/cinnamic acid dioxygenase ferredoxin--NAD(+) reductase component [Pseudomonas fluorescens]|uniref:FAD-dependent oxidoreductase n=1 Tax=Pseudomonas fluorescens TaxID=294 RepID=UPI001256398F|nr:FAD-dependent oxidoreductase [Pseudomonas fluorescens]CAG8863334.1 3-phenylpropionate/cinnamic acid dioxygenase ferredoxin--NAD(+) reductase component [Pseudomonas fluorescens]VVQ01521.1 3-phenylpropionate/cinnamic acid dioxygenase ferredoxin--NAD(+) reductase component [Pseudomonas fluorescens]